MAKGRLNSFGRLARVLAADWEYSSGFDLIAMDRMATGMPYRLWIPSTREPQMERILEKPERSDHG